MLTGSDAELDCWVRFLLSVRETSGVFVSLECANVDVLMFRSVPCLLQRWVVTGDLYRHHTVMQASWNVVKCSYCEQYTHKYSTYRVAQQIAFHHAHTRGSR